MRPLTRRDGPQLFEPTRDLRPSVLGPQGISDRVLEAMGQTKRHRFIHRAILVRSHTWTSDSHWPRPDNIAAVHSRPDEPSRCGQVR